MCVRDINIDRPIYLVVICMGRILPIFLAMLVVVSIGGMVVYAKPTWRGNVDTIYADGIVVQFHERTPEYRIWIPRKNDTAVYIVKFNRIIEFIDKDNDGKFDGSIDEILAHAPLTAHDIWEVTDETITLEDGTTELRVLFNGTAEVLPMSPGPRIGFAEVAFINHIYDRDTNVSGYIIEGGRELKIDIVISDWPWSSDESKLALEIVFAGMFKGKERTPHCYREREQIRYKNVKVHRIRMEGDADYYAEFRYTEQAQIRNRNRAANCCVNASDQFKQNSAITWLVYPHFNGTLVHDPSIYAGEMGGAVSILRGYLPIIVAIVIGVVVVVVVLKKIRK